MVHACNGIIISENTGSPPIALLFGRVPGLRAWQRSELSCALMLGSPRCLQLHHLSAQLRWLPLVSTVAARRRRLTQTALTGNPATHYSSTCNVLFANREHCPEIARDSFSKSDIGECSNAAISCRYSCEYNCCLCEMAALLVTTVPSLKRVNAMCVNVWLT